VSLLRLFALSHHASTFFLHRPRQGSSIDDTWQHNPFPNST
jgi:hypothetical protein